MDSTITQFFIVYSFFLPLFFIPTNSSSPLPFPSSDQGRRPNTHASAGTSHTLAGRSKFGMTMAPAQWITVSTGIESQVLKFPITVSTGQCFQRGTKASSTHKHKHFGSHM
jgi:hypothetical protein